MKSKLSSVPGRLLNTCLTLCLAIASLSSLAEDKRSRDFPFAIQTALGASEFAPGDGIVITSLRGTRRHLEPGARYLVEGTYTLSSADEADLAFFLTSRGLGGPVAISDEEHVVVRRGSGNFRLIRTFGRDGWLHLSFYVQERAHGGIYFGEKGNENTILQTKTWSDFAPGSGSSSWGSTTEANRAIMAYLGEPVPAPTALDSKYTASAVLAAFKGASSDGGFEIRSVAVDETEFPFLVYGVLAGKHEFQEIEKAIIKVKGYVYGGSVVGGNEKGTHFAFNIIPSDQYPSTQATTCHRRLMIRLQMLADRARQSL